MIVFNSSICVCIFFELVCNLHARKNSSLRKGVQRCNQSHFLCLHLVHKIALFLVHSLSHAHAHARTWNHPRISSSSSSWTEKGEKFFTPENGNKFRFMLFHFWIVVRKISLFPHNSVCGLSLLRLKEYGVAEVTVFFLENRHQTFFLKNRFIEIFFVVKMKIAMMTLDFSVCCSFFFACLVSFLVFFFFFCFTKFTSSLYSRLFFELSVLIQYDDIHRHSKNYYGMLLLRPTAQTSIPFDSIQWVYRERMWASVCLCVCAGVSQLSFSFLLFRSLFTHALSLSRLAASVSRSVCKCASVCESFQRYTEMRMQSPYMLVHTYGWTGQSKSNSKSKSERVCERCYMPPAYIFHLCLSLHISIYHTYTPTHACTHSLTLRLTLKFPSKRATMCVCYVRVIGSSICTDKLLLLLLLHTHWFLINFFHAVKNKLWTDFLLNLYEFSKIIQFLWKFLVNLEWKKEMQNFCFDFGKSVCIGIAHVCTDCVEYLCGILVFLRAVFFISKWLPLCMPHTTHTCTDIGTDTYHRYYVIFFCSSRLLLLEKKKAENVRGVPTQCVRSEIKMHLCWWIREIGI